MGIPRLKCVRRLCGSWRKQRIGVASCAFHAAARAVSGGPIYVSDKLGHHNFDLLRKLVLSDGSVLRADYPGRPTRDCLYADPTHDPVALKIFNANGDCGILGLFNVRHGTGSEQGVGGTVAASDIPVLRPGDYVAFYHRSSHLRPCAFDERESFELAEGEWELVSFAPVENGFAALGLADKFNSTRALSARIWKEGECHLSLRDGGKFLAWSVRKPSTVMCNDLPVAFSYDAAGSALAAKIPAGHSHRLVIRWT